jgi:retinol dehydrogenase-14
MLLTSILFPKLNSVRSPSRVVVLSSTAHTFGEIDVNDLHFSKRMYLPWTAYGQSKLANLIFAKWLADKFSAIKSQSTAVAVHPGVVQTDLWRSTPMAE